VPFQCVQQVRVLLVEDRDELYELYSDGLAAAGFAVEGASSGSEALKRAARVRPDLVLMDLDLPEPELDGFETARQLRADPETRAIPVVAYGFPRWQRLGVLIGCDILLVKPVLPSQLVTAALRLVERIAPAPEDLRP
jgi:CheY-like chemotaxis protein